MMKRSIVLIAHNLRSAHNVGSLLRTADGLGVDTVYLTGYTPYPVHPNDERLPHLSAKIQRVIEKTALGAETAQKWDYSQNVIATINGLKQQGYDIYALEQTKESLPLPQFKPSGKVALVVGNEVDGLQDAVLEICDAALEIPMVGAKESYNVTQAAAMALYHTKFINR